MGLFSWLTSHSDTEQDDGQYDPDSDLDALRDWHIAEDQAEGCAEGVRLNSNGDYVIGCDTLFEASYCGNTGKVDCALCERDDPSRYGGGAPGYVYPTCIDCGEEPGIIGEVDCECCHGLGYIPCDADGNTG